MIKNLINKKTFYHRIFSLILKDILSINFLLIICYATIVLYLSIILITNLYIIVNMLLKFVIYINKVENINLLDWKYPLIIALIILSGNVLLKFIYYKTKLQYEPYTELKDIIIVVPKEIYPVNINTLGIQHIGKVGIIYVKFSYPTITLVCAWVSDYKGLIKRGWSIDKSNQPTAGHLANILESIKIAGQDNLTEQLVSDIPGLKNFLNGAYPGIFSVKHPKISQRLIHILRHSY